jgi:hypothetical protein
VLVIGGVVAKFDGACRARGYGSQLFGALPEDGRCTLDVAVVGPITRQAASPHGSEHRHFLDDV